MITREVTIDLGPSLVSVIVKFLLDKTLELKSGIYWSALSVTMEIICSTHLQLT